MFTVSSVTIPQTHRHNPDGPGLNHKNRWGCSERSNAELGPVAGGTGPVWGRERFLPGRPEACLPLLWWILFNFIYLAFC